MGAPGPGAIVAWKSTADRRHRQTIHESAQEATRRATETGRCGAAEVVFSAAIGGSHVAGTIPDQSVSWIQRSATAAVQVMSTGDAAAGKLALDAYRSDSAHYFALVRLHNEEAWKRAALDPERIMQEYTSSVLVADIYRTPAWLSIPGQVRKRHIFPALSTQTPPDYTPSRADECMLRRAQAEEEHARIACARDTDDAWLHRHTSSAFHNAHEVVLATRGGTSEYRNTDAARACVAITQKWTRDRNWLVIATLPTDCCGQANYHRTHAQCRAAVDKMLGDVVGYLHRVKDPDTASNHVLSRVEYARRQADEAIARLATRVAHCAEAKGSDDDTRDQRAMLALIRLSRVLAIEQNFHATNDILKRVAAAAQGASTGTGLAQRTAAASRHVAVSTKAAHEILTTSRPETEESAVYAVLTGEGGMVSLACSVDAYTRVADALQSALDQNPITVNDLHGHVVGARAEAMEVIDEKMDDAMRYTNLLWNTVRTAAIDATTAGDADSKNEHAFSRPLIDLHNHATSVVGSSRASEHASDHHTRARLNFDGLHVARPGDAPLSPEDIADAHAIVERVAEVLKTLPAEQSTTVLREMADNLLRNAVVVIAQRDVTAWAILNAITPPAAIVHALTGQRAEKRKRRNLYGMQGRAARSKRSRGY